MEQICVIKIVSIVLAPIIVIVTLVLCWVPTILHAKLTRDVIYSKIESLIFVDVNECNQTNDTNICEHICYNVVGSYYCECNTGFILDNETNSTCNGRL